jgi:hypothetical protein
MSAKGEPMAAIAFSLFASAVFAAAGYRWPSGFMCGLAVSLAVMRWKTGIW